MLSTRNVHMFHILLCFANKKDYIPSLLSYARTIAKSRLIEFTDN